MSCSFYFGEIVLISKNLQFAKVVGYEKVQSKKYATQKIGMYNLKLFQKRSNSRKSFVDIKQNAEQWQDVNKINLKTNIIQLQAKYIIKIAPTFDYWLIYNLRYWLQKLFRQPRPHYQKYIMLQFRETIINKRINKKKQEIKELFKTQKDLFNTIGEWDGYASEYNFICSKLAFKYDINQVLKMKKAIEFMKKY